MIQGKNHAYEFIGRQETQKLIDTHAETEPKVVEELIKQTGYSVINNYGDLDLLHNSFILSILLLIQTFESKLKEA